MSQSNHVIVGVVGRGRRAVVQPLEVSMITTVLAAVAVRAAARVTAVVDIGVLPKCSSGQSSRPGPRPIATPTAANIVVDMILQQQYKHFQAHVVP